MEVARAFGQVIRMKLLATGSASTSCRTARVKKRKHCQRGLSLDRQGPPNGITRDGGVASQRRWLRPDWPCPASCDPVNILQALRHFRERDSAVIPLKDGPCPMSGLPKPLTLPDFSAKRNLFSRRSGCALLELDFAN